MSNYILKTSEQKKEIVKISTTKTYEFNPKNDTIKGIKIKKVCIYDEKQIQNILIKKYLIKFKKLMVLIKATSDSDSSDSNYLYCFDEIARLRDILNYKYKKFLKKSIYEKFINDLIFYEKYLQDKLIEYKMQNDNDLQR